MGAMEGVVEPCEGVGGDWLGEEGDSGALGERLVEMEELGEGGCCWTKTPLGCHTWPARGR